MVSGAEPEPERPAAEESLGDFARETDAFIAESDARLRAIEAAIAAVDQGNYGRCEICGKAIEAPRLAERPSHRRCSEHDDTPSAEPRLF